MQILAENPKARRPVFNREDVRQRLSAEYSGRKDPTADTFSQFNFEQSVFPLEGGRVALRLRKPLTLKVDFTTLRFTVCDWGIEMDITELPHLPREVTRLFLRLLHAADNEALTEEEQARWLKITDYIDFKQFTIDRSPPRYLEGKLRTRGEVTVVEWHDGETERLATQVARRLSDVDPGERFGAFVKLGKNDSTIDIHRVTLLPQEEPSWESWPKQT